MLIFICCSIILGFFFLPVLMVLARLANPETIMQNKEEKLNREKTQKEHENYMREFGYAHRERMAAIKVKKEI